MKKLYSQARFSKMSQDALRRNTPNYSQLSKSKMLQDVARCSKMGKILRHNYSQLLPNTHQQDGKTVKNTDQKIQVLWCFKLLFNWLYFIFSNIAPAPPPLY